MADINNIPSDWSISKLKELAGINSSSLAGNTDPQKQLYYQDLASVRASRIKLESIKVKFKDAPSRARRLAKSGDILMSTVRPYLHGFTQVDFDTKDYVFSTGFAIISPLDNRRAGLIYQSLFSEYLNYQYHSILTGSSYPALNTSDVSILKIAHPSCPDECEEIAAILKTGDQAIESQEQLIAQKQKRQKSLMQKLLYGATRFPEFSGKAWREETLGSLLKHVFRPIDWSPELKLRLVSIRRRSGGLFLRPELTGSEYKTSDLHEIRENDFLISKRQVTHGALSVVSQKFEGGHVSKEYTIFENRNPQRLYMPFLDWLSKMPQMWHLAYVASNGVAIEKLIFVPKDFLKFEILLPPTIEEQKKITEVLEACEAEIAQSIKKLDQLKLQKKGLMQQLLTGKTRVKI